ncbi:hypothetical protein T439DRAFT_323737 [Meredithblackwellia eburnea MCA 4105]
MRRFSSQSRPSTTQQQQQADLSRANTYQGGGRPQRQDPFADMASMGGDLPPPDYNSALRASINGPPTGHQQQQQQQQQYQPPPRSPPQQQQAPPQSPPQTQHHRTPSAASGPAGVQRRDSVEDPFSTLGRYDLVFMVDDSPSMVDLWAETKSALMGVAAKCVKYDKDGIELLFLNNETHLHNVTSDSTIREAFDSVVPSGSTPTGLQLDEVLRPYIESVEDAKTTKAKVKPLVLVVLTDGRADDTDLVKEVIIEMAQRLDDIRAPPRQLGISLIQIGDDEDAAAFLKELDDDLKAEAGVRDIVATVPYQGQMSTDFILKAALGSVMRLK